MIVIASECFTSAKISKLLTDFCVFKEVLMVLLALQIVLKEIRQGPWCFDKEKHG